MPSHVINPYTLERLMSSVGFAAGAQLALKGEPIFHVGALRKPKPVMCVVLAPAGLKVGRDLRYGQNVN